MKQEVSIPLDKRKYMLISAVVATLFLCGTGVGVATGTITSHLGVGIGVFSVAMALFIAITITFFSQIRAACRIGAIGPSDLVPSLLTMLVVGGVFGLGMINVRLPGLILGAGLVISFVAWAVNKMRGRRTIH